METLKVKNRFKEVAHMIIHQMRKGENQGNFDLDEDKQPLTTRERFDAAEEVLSETGIKVGISAHTDDDCYSWETI
jgi:hypothetical protein